MKNWFVLLILCFSVNLFAEESLDEIDLDKIPQKKVRAYINQQKKNKIINFSDIKCGWPMTADTMRVRHLQYNYVIDEDIEKVWQYYLYLSPSDAWNSRKITFGLLLSKKQKSIMYCNDPGFPGITEGQVMYLNLKLGGGIYNLAVGFEVVGVNNSKKTIKFSYLRDGKAYGVQTIALEKGGDGVTHVSHVTDFFSDSKFRDRMLYPFFHHKVTNAFHANIENHVFGANDSNDQTIKKAELSYVGN